MSLYATRGKTLCVNQVVIEYALVTLLIFEITSRNTENENRFYYLYNH